MPRPGAPQVLAAAVALAALGTSCGGRTPPPAGEPGRPGAASASPAKAPAPVAPEALGDEVRPRAYRLTLELDPDAPGYRGEIEIDVELAAPTRVIWLHAAVPVAVRSASATAGGDRQPAAVTAPTAEGVIGLELGRALPAGPATLHLRFAGRYRDTDAVFVQESRGRRYVYTDFEPIDARRAFPCFDEPRWKAPWQVTVRAPDGAAVHGNTTVAARTRQGDGWTATRFAPTPPLPTYLIAVAVGPFEEVEVPGSPVPARILVPAGQRAAAAAAAELFGPLTRAAVEVMGRPLPFAKLDVAVVPVFGGAMENPGLFTIAADFALSPAGPDERRTLARILAHELAHLWFGDLVTLADWREVWLNEGAASWLADEVVARAFPAMAVELHTQLDRADAMVEDSLPGIHPLRPEHIHHPRQLFDTIGYKKGAAVWHGLEGWLGPERFRAGLAVYLDRHAWGTVTTDDLAAALATVAPELPVAAVVLAAARGVGVPVIDVEVRCRADGALARLRHDGPRRPQPVCLRWGGDGAGDAGRGCAVVDGVATLDLGPRCPGWVHPGDGDGYYRWRLPPAWWPALGRAPLSAVQTGDALEMVEAALAAGAIGAAEARPLLVAAVRSGEPTLVEPALELVRLALRVSGPADARALAAELQQASRHLLATIGPTPRRDDPPGRGRARAAVLRAAGELAADRAIVGWARRQVRAWRGGAALPDQLAEAALVVTATHAGRRDRDALVAAAHRAGAQRDAVAVALGRALAALPGDVGLELLRQRGRAPLDRRLELGLVAELVADPRRADAALAALGPAAAVYPALLRDAPWCAAAPVAGPAAARTEALVTLRAERCRAVVAALAPRAGRQR